MRRACLKSVKLLMLIAECFSIDTTRELCSSNGQVTKDL